MPYPLLTTHGLVAGVARYATRRHGTFVMARTQTVPDEAQKCARLGRAPACPLGVPAEPRTLKSRTLTNDRIDESFLRVVHASESWNTSVETQAITLGCCPAVSGRTN